MPAKWKATYQKLADRIHAPVYCPRWMPDPLTGEIGPTVSFGGAGGSSLSVDKDRSYLALFVWAEPVHGQPACRRAVELPAGRRQPEPDSE